MIPVLSLLVVLMVSFVITRVASSALMHTGLSREVARFQARSALTGAGFTTTESERLVNHPLRRRILMVLMLVGNAGIITAVSSLMLAFVNGGDDSSLWMKILLLVTGLVLLWAAATSQYVDRRLSRWIDRLLTRYSSIEVRDFGSLLGLTGDYRIVELVIAGSDWLANKSIKESELAKEGVLVLAVQRRNGHFIGTPDGDVCLEAEDNLVLYGHLDALENLDERRYGSKGNQEHEQAKKNKDQRVAQEQEDDPAKSSQSDSRD